MITVTKDQASKALVGIHGWYVKLSPSLGVKVVRSPLYRSKSKAYRSRAYTKAVLEADTLQYAYETGVVPRCYGVTLVKVKSGFQVGILMQHLGSITLANSEFYDAGEVFEDLHDKLEEIGIYHGDLHEDNIMIYRGKYYAIDFSPGCISTED